MSQRRFAFLFGANGPEGANLRSLQYAQNDIKHLRTAFLNSFCNFHQVADHIADTANILLAQLERFAYTCERPDLLVVHFSGHGFVWNRQFYLLCNTTDVDAKLFNSTAINIIQIKTVLDQCKAKHKLLILDCCFAGIAQAGGTWKSEEQLPGLESLKGSVNAILAACPAHRRTRELDALELYREKGAGFLSWAIARASDEQFTQVARDHALSLSDILEWLPHARDGINKSLSLSPEDCVPAPRILHERDLVGDDEIWFTSRRRSNSYDERQGEKRQREEHALFEHMPFLQRPCLGARLEDFDADRVQKYAQHDGDAVFLSFDNLPRHCQQLGLTSTIGTPTKAAVLAFHKNPSRHLHSALIRATCYVTDERDRYLKEDIKGPLGKQVEHAFRWLLGNLRTISEHVNAGKRVDRYELPEYALRELIANAVVHRDYEANETIQIKITQSQITITNPGRLHEAIINYKPPFAYPESHPYNADLLNMLVAEHWAEGRSRGFEIVMEEFRKYNLTLPEIKNLPGNLVQVIIQRPGVDEMLPVWTVPYLRNPFFTGRDEILDQLHQRLAPVRQNDFTKMPRVALTQPQAIRGLGGIGKTQTAVEYAYRCRDLNYYTHTLWVNAATEEAVISSLMGIARVLPSFSAKNETDQQKLVEAVIRWLEQCEQPWLLIFDHADELSILPKYLPRRGSGSILLTTRTSIVGGFATSIEVETMGFVEGTQLLLQRAQLFDQASDDMINEAGNIVIALDSFPLALDQAGAFIEETRCSLADYLQLYQNHRQTLLARRGMQATNYPSSVAATWSLSFQKVEQANPAAAQLLHLCAFLAPDQIPEELIRDAAAHWPSPLQQAATDIYTFNQMIAELLKFSFIKRLTETNMLSIHRLVQAIQIDTMEPDVQRNWAERVVRAVNEIFPDSPKDIATWPQGLRYLDQAQACSLLTTIYHLPLIEVGDLLNRTGLYLHEHALYLEAEQLYQSALQIREQQLGTGHPQTAASLNNLAELYRSQGKYEEAEPLYRRALAISEQVLGTEHPQTAASLNNLAGLYYSQGKYEEAEPLYQQALAISERILGTEHPDIATNLNNLALLYDSQGKQEEAEHFYRRALAISEQVLGTEHHQTKTFRKNYVLLLKSMGKDEELKK